MWKGMYDSSSKLVLLRVQAGQECELVCGRITARSRLVTMQGRGYLKDMYDNSSKLLMTTARER